MAVRCWNFHQIYSTILLCCAIALSSCNSSSDSQTSGSTVSTEASPSPSSTPTPTPTGASAANSTITGTGPILPNGVSSSTITINLKDVLNQAVVGVTPTFAATNTGGTNIYGACSATNTNGISTCTLKSSNAETKVLFVTSPIKVTGGTIQFQSQISLSGSSWPFTAGTDSTYTCTTGSGAKFTGSQGLNNCNIQLTGSIAELSTSSQIDSSAANFDSGTFTGGAEYDSSNGVVRLSTNNPNIELDSSWTPGWSNLIGYWKLDEAVGSGSVVDSSSGGAYTATPANVTLGATSASSGLGTAAIFNGTNSSILSNSSFPIGNANFSISAWASRTTNGNFDGIVGLGTQGTEQGLQFGFTPSNNFYVDFYNDRLTSSTAYTDALWHHYAFTFSASNRAAILYRDGVQVGSGTLNSIFKGTGALCIGGNYSNCLNSFHGSIDDVAIWNTTLSPSAVQTIYQHEAAKYTGTFTSRVIDGLGPGQSWTSLDWVTTLPFFKELPDGGSSETNTNYASQTSNLMSGVTGLWHLDEASGAATAYDRSGEGTPNNGTIESGVTMGGVGKTGTAASFDGISGYITMGNPTTLNSGTSDFSVAVWANITTPAAGSYLLSKRQWCGFGNFWNIQVKSTGILADEIDGGAIGSYYILNGTKIVGNTGWHHVALVRSGIKLSLYIDGEIDNSITTGASPVDVTGSGNFQVGADPCTGTGGSTYLAGTVDEVGYWNRALGDGTSGSSNEILELYRRGANRIKFQVRSCSASTCSDDPNGTNWKGPDNSNQTYFTELNNNSVPSTGGDLSTSDSVLTGAPNLSFVAPSASPTPFPSLSISTNRYFQYRAVMESDDANSLCNYGSGATTCSPELSSVNIGPTHYDSTAPTISNSVGIPFHSLTSITEALGSANGCAGGTRYAISADGSNYYYYNGSSWIISGGYSTAAPIYVYTTPVLETFAKSVNTGNFFFKAYLKSDGSHACELDNLSISGTQ